MPTLRASLPPGWLGYPLVRSWAEYDEDGNITARVEIRTNESGVRVKARTPVPLTCAYVPHYKDRGRNPAPEAIAP